jgi:hypothetical protein
MGWAKLRVIDLNTLIPNVAKAECMISGMAEGSQVIIISTCACYIVDLKSERVTKVALDGRKFFPYMSFYRKNARALHWKKK